MQSKREQEERDMKAKESELTVITVSYKMENQEGSLKDLFEIIRKITSEIEEKEGLKIITGTKAIKHEHIHTSIYINRKIDTDIEKTWKHGHSCVGQYNTNDHASFIKYVCC